MTGLRMVGAAEVDAALPIVALVDRLQQAFRDGAEVPLRHHHTVATPEGIAGTLLLMPAWRTGGALGVKCVTVFPGNQAKGLASVLGVYLLLDATTGQPRAVLDGVTLTLRRTAAASALAARYLARTDARRLVLVGAGALSAHLARAHATVRPIDDVVVWNRTPERAQAVARELAAEGLKASATTELEAAVRTADLVSCATMSATPVVRGAWLKPGAHLDLVGGYTPTMRETDDEAIRRARVYVDTRAGAGKEAGDIVQPLRAGVLTEAQIAGDLFELARGQAQGRRSAEEITLFKSVGTAIEDLAAAELAAENLGIAA
jgi:ornithine cyclodeaminase